MSSTPPPGPISRASTTGSTATGSGTSSYLPVSLSNLWRRLSSDNSRTTSPEHSLTHSLTFPQTATDRASQDDMSKGNLYTPPQRTASPFQPPPLCPLSLKGWRDNTPEDARLLSKAVAEEIRLLIPARLQLADEWGLVYSLEQNGVSLGTMYKKCEELRGRRNGYVLVVKDGEGGLFGAYLSEAPHIASHYFGTGECFLWRASTFTQASLNPNHLPLPPSADTTNMQRSTTINGSTTANGAASRSSGSLAPPTAPPSRTTSPLQIRFKAFPYSGINDYIMLCDAQFFSIGGGDGHYGLWLDSIFERGISSRCLTFGNEPLSEEGEKFDVVGVELWGFGNLD